MTTPEIAIRTTPLVRRVWWQRVSHATRGPRVQLRDEQDRPYELRLASWQDARALIRALEIALAAPARPRRRAKASGARR